jgi:hypothetical protein
MNKFTSAAVGAIALALIGSTPAFAGGREGGPDTVNAVEHVGAPANGPEIWVWGGQEIDTRPTVSANAVTGGSPEAVETTNEGRLTWRTITTPDNSATAVAKEQAVQYHNG